MKATKILCTLGPATDKPGIVVELAKNGMTAARINFSHGGQDAQGARIESVRKAEQAVGRPLAVIADLQGPKIRLGKFPGGPVKLRKGDDVDVMGGEGSCDAQGLRIDYAQALSDLSAGSDIFIADGLVHLRVKQVQDDKARCAVLRGGIVSDHKGVNLPGVPIRLPSLTEKDRRDALAAVRLGCDAIALSFVRTADDVGMLRDLLRGEGANLPIIAKLERSEAMENLDAILAAADGIMVARGDLGVEVGVEQVPILQKRILERARVFNRPAIVATQMLESMQNAPVPTRAEVSDVANAILDGADTVMLSGETAIGAFPVETVQTMRKIADRAETIIVPHRVVGTGDYSVAEALAESVLSLIEMLSIRAVVVNTRSGFTARLLSKRRLPVPVFVVTPDPSVARQCALYFGCESLAVTSIRQIDQLGRFAGDRLMGGGQVKAGDRIAVVAGLGQNQVGTTDVLHVLVAGSESPPGTERS